MEPGAGWRVTRSAPRLPGGPAARICLERRGPASRGFGNWDAHGVFCSGKLPHATHEAILARCTKSNVPRCRYISVSLHLSVRPDSKKKSNLPTEAHFTHSALVRHGRVAIRPSQSTTPPPPSRAATIPRGASHPRGTSVPRGEEESSTRGTLLAALQTAAATGPSRQHLALRLQAPCARLDVIIVVGVQILLHVRRWRDELRLRQSS